MWKINNRSLEHVYYKEHFYLTFKQFLSLDLDIESSILMSILSPESLKSIFYIHHQISLCSIAPQQASCQFVVLLLIHLLLCLLVLSCLLTTLPGVDSSRSVGGVNTSLCWGVMLYSFLFFFRAGVLAILKSVLLLALFSPSGTGLKAKLCFSLKIFPSERLDSALLRDIDLQNGDG